LTKIETLRSAYNYIQLLTDTLRTLDDCQALAERSNSKQFQQLGSSWTDTLRTLDDCHALAEHSNSSEQFQPGSSSWTDVGQRQYQAPGLLDYCNTALTIPLQQQQQQSSCIYDHHQQCTIYPADQLTTCIYPDSCCDFDTDVYKADDSFTYL